MKKLDEESNFSTSAKDTSLYINLDPSFDQKIEVNQLKKKIIVL